jgi:putative transposase
MNRTPYSTDLTDAEWNLVEPLLPPAKPGGRHRTVNLREVLNAIRYLVRTGCTWRLLPHEFPPWGTVHYYYRRWRLDGTWQTLHDTLRSRVRQAAGREPTPQTALLDSQSVKTTEKGGPVYDAGKKIKGRKRHLLVDTLGLVWGLVVTSAATSDPAGARLLFQQAHKELVRLQQIWADGIYRGSLIAWVTEQFGWALEVVRRPAAGNGFTALPHRWIVERTFGWLNRYRRLSKDYEQLPDSSKAMIHLAMISLMLRRLRPK